MAEAVKINLHLRLDARLFFWRDKIGSEVDLLVEHGSQLRTVEFKAGQTVAGDWFGSLRKYAALQQTAASAAHAPAQPEPGARPMLVYADSQPQVRDVTDVCPWREWPEQALNQLQNQ